MSFSLAAPKNNVTATRVPTQWSLGRDDAGLDERKREEARNIKWAARLGSQTYGNPVVSGGRVFVGTNNGAGYLKRYPSSVDLGCLLCLQESDGQFL